MSAALFDPLSDDINCLFTVNFASVETMSSASREECVSSLVAAQMALITSQSTIDLFTSTLTFTVAANCKHILYSVFLWFSSID